MNYGPYPFEQLLQDVQDETGITNIRNRIPEIKRLVRRAEMEINPYSGFLIKKRMLLFKGNGNFDGMKIKLPKDYVQLDTVERCCGHCKWHETANHIVLCGDSRDHIEYIYWGIQFDDDGNPMIPYNHGEACVSYVIWKMYSQKTFMGEGSHNVRNNYEDIFNNRAHEARGEDMFPDEMSMLGIYQTNRMSNRDLLRKSIEDACKDSCLEEYCGYSFAESQPDITEPVTDTAIYISQYNDILSGINDVESITLEVIVNYYIDDPLSEYEEGKLLTFNNVGRIIIAIQDEEDSEFEIYDQFNNNVTTEFDRVFDNTKNMIFYVSKNYYNPGDYFTKIIKK